jgi:hypothetical protein
MRAWSEVAACVALLRDTPGWVVKRDFGPEGAFIEWGYDVLKVGLAGAPEPDLSRVGQLADRFCNSLATGRRAVDLWTPLYGVDLGDEVEDATAILGECSITRPNPEERTLLAWCHRGQIPPWAPTTIFLHTACHSDLADHRVDNFSDMEGTSLAVRLVLGGRSRTHESMAIAQPGDCRPPGYVGEFQAFGGALTDSTGHERSVAASPADIERIRKLAPACRMLMDHYWFAVDQFRSSSQRNRFTDVLVDAVVGLENLLLPDTSSELAFRLALCGAWILGADDPGLRRQWFGRLKAAYAVRNAVVHGGGGRKHRPQSDFARKEAMDSVEALRLILTNLAESGLERDAWKAHVSDVALG